MLRKWAVFSANLNFKKRQTTGGNCRKKEVWIMLFMLFIYRWYSPVYTHTTPTHTQLASSDKIICLCSAADVTVCVCVWMFRQAHGGSRFIEIILHFSSLQQLRDWSPCSVCVCVFLSMAYDDVRFVYMCVWASPPSLLWGSSWWLSSKREKVKKKPTHLSYYWKYLLTISASGKESVCVSVT